MKRKRGRELFCALICLGTLVSFALQPSVFTAAATEELKLTVPTFAPMCVGYTQPEEQPITIENTGETVFSGVAVELQGDAFTLISPAGKIWLYPGKTSQDFKLRPKEELPEGEYNATVTVSCGEQSVTAEVSFTVSPESSDQKPSDYTPPGEGVFAPGAPQTLEELRASDPAQVAQIEAFDSRNYGIVPPVKDQGSTNLCWSYASITAAEISIHRQGTDPAATPDTLRLSPELLGLARHNRGADPLGNVKGEYTQQAGSYLYAPGDTSLTPPLFSQWVAPIPLGGSSDNLYGQCAYRLSAAVQPCTYGMSKDAAIAAVKQAIAQYGAVTASYNNLRETDFYNPRNESGSGSSPHACVIIGWDDNIPAERFFPGGATRNGGWLVKNSYSSLPYFWLSYDLGLGSEVWAFSFTPKDTYDFNYFYDCTAQDFGLAVSQNITTGANVFTAKKGMQEQPEYLKAVQAAFQGGTNAVYEISVYTGLADANDPESGIQAGTTIVSDTFERQGYYTVPLTQAVLLEPGESFSVVVTVRGSGTPVLRMSQDSSNGKSWRCRDGSWSQVLQALRIKALTVLGEKSDLPTPTPAPTAEPTPTATPAEWTNPFADVEKDAWYYEDVRYTAEHKLFYGTSDTTFSPDKAMTRGMMAAVLYRMAGEPDMENEDPGGSFEDVDANAYYATAVCWARSRGIVSGYGNGKFGPNAPITREQLAAMLYRYAGFPVPTETLADFTDADSASAYAVDALRWTAEQGILHGRDGGVLDPTGRATRAEAAAMLQRFCERIRG